MSNLISKALAWLILSSKNPETVSLTVRSALTLALTWVTVIAGLGHIQLPSADITALIDGIVQFVQLALMLVSVITGIYGIARKIWLSFAGQHAGLNSLSQ